MNETRRIVLEWLDSFDNRLTSEAQQFGLFGHRATVGAAREFLIHRILKQLLPAGVEIGSGIVIDSSDHQSRQVDVVVYDSRFPRLGSGGPSLYLVEGVLATIEVKSVINGQSLREGLDNCKSVLDLDVVGQCPAEASSRIAHYQQKQGLTEIESRERLKYMVRPATYIFGFASELKYEAAGRHIHQWWDANFKSWGAYCPPLPRMIVAEDFVAVTSDGLFQIGADPDGITFKDDGSPMPPTMAAFESKDRFRWFGLHLLNSVSARIGMRNYLEEFDYQVLQYFPIEEYGRRIPENGVLIRKGKFSQPLLEQQ